MEIEFSLGSEDVLAFSRYHNANSPTVRRGLLFARLLVPVTCVLLWIVLFAAREMVFGVVMGAALGLAAITFYLIYPTLVRSLIHRTVARLYADRDKRGVFGRRRLTITPETISEAGEITTTTKEWAAVDKIAVDEDHAYFYTGALSALILPRAAFATEGEFYEFVETAWRYQQEAAN